MWWTSVLLVGPASPSHLPCGVHPVAHISHHHTRSPVPACPVRRRWPSVSSRGILPSLALGDHIATPLTPPQAMLDDTGLLTDRLLPSQLVVEKCFFFFLALRINLNLNLSFFSSVASSLCSHHVAKPYSLLMDSIRRAGAVCSRVGEELPHLHHRLPFFKVWVKHCTAVCNCQCLFTNHHPQWLPKWLQLPNKITIILRVE